MQYDKQRRARKSTSTNALLHAITFAQSRKRGFLTTSHPTLACYPKPLDVAEALKLAACISEHEPCKCGTTAWGGILYLLSQEWNVPSSSQGQDLEAIAMLPDNV
jgi:hypothetical protein